VPYFYPIVFLKIERKQSLYLKDILDGIICVTKRLLLPKDNAPYIQHNLVNEYRDIVGCLMSFAEQLKPRVCCLSYDELKSYYESFYKKTLLGWNEYQMDKSRHFLVAL